MSSSIETEIAIIGGGCVGTSILHELVQRGHSNVVLIDNGRNTLSATAQSGGMIRVFHERLEHLDLALKNQKILLQYQQRGILRESNKPNGSLYFFHSVRLQNYIGQLKKLESSNYPYEFLNFSNGKARFPDFRWRKDECAIFEPTASHLSPSKFSEELLARCSNGGARVLDSFEVTRICPYLDRYRITGPNGCVTTRLLIIAGGARFLPRLRDLGVSLPLEQKLLTVYASEKIDKNFVLPNYFDRETLEYARLGPGREVLLSHPGSDRVITRKWKTENRVQAAVDCYAPDRVGFMGKVPGHPRLILATGWGGTAFKFALEIGRRSAHIVERDLSPRRLVYA
jgi:glycine/D-amino acid oxidase-like deaminating enzyme